MGHDPTFSFLPGYLIGANRFGATSLKTGAVALLETGIAPPAEGSATLDSAVATQDADALDDQPANARASIEPNIATPPVAITTISVLNFDSTLPSSAAIFESKSEWDTSIL